MRARSIAGCSTAGPSRSRGCPTCRSGSASTSPKHGPSSARGSRTTIRFPTAPTSSCWTARTGGVECVLMAEEDRRTVCISTQVGCGMGCVFCASGLKGVERNLTRAEIVEQVLRLRNLLPAEERLTNLVVMGMGESLANLDNLFAALDLALFARRAGAGPAAGDDLDGRAAREDAQARGAGPAVSPGGLAARADRGAARRAGAGQCQGRA